MRAASFCYQSCVLGRAGAREQVLTRATLCSLQQHRYLYFEKIGRRGRKGVRERPRTSCFAVHTGYTGKVRSFHLASRASLSPDLSRLPLVHSSGSGSRQNAGAGGAKNWYVSANRAALGEGFRMAKLRVSSQSAFVRWVFFSGLSRWNVVVLCRCWIRDICFGIISCCAGRVVFVLSLQLACWTTWETAAVCPKNCITLVVVIMYSEK